MLCSCNEEAFFDVFTAAEKLIAGPCDRLQCCFSVWGASGMHTSLFKLTPKILITEVALLSTHIIATSKTSPQIVVYVQNGHTIDLFITVLGVLYFWPEDS